jgi:hypothetical protein
MAAIRWLTACCAVTCIAVTGCASLAGNPAPATAERAAVLPEAEKVFRQLLAAGVRLVPGVSGDYERCGAEDPLVSPPNANWVQYSALVTIAQGAGRASSAAFVIKALDGASWGLERRGAGSYAGRNRSFDLWLDVISFEPYSNATQILINVSGACVNAGASAVSLTQGPTDHVKEPASTPTSS